MLSLCIGFVGGKEESEKKSRSFVSSGALCVLLVFNVESLPQRRFDARTANEAG